MKSPRVQNRALLDAAAAAAATNNPHKHNGGAADQLRACFDARDLSSTPSFDIEDVVRASFQKERSRSSVDGKESGRRESPHLGSGGGSRYKDPPRSSVDGGSGGGGHPTRLSMDSSRLSMRIKEAVRAAVEGRLDSVRSSFDSKESLRSASNRCRSREAPTPRSSTTDSRLLVELRESPRLSRDAPRYSCDGRDVLRSTPTFDISIRNSDHHYLQPSDAISSRESLRAGAQKARESPRLSVDGRGGSTPPALFRPPVFERESPRLPHEVLHTSSNYHHKSSRSEVDAKDLQRLQQFSSGEPRRRVPSLVARLMGLEDLPDDLKPNPLPLQQTATSVVPLETRPVSVPRHIMVPQKKPSKESKLLKGLLHYNPRIEEARLGNDSRHGEPYQAQDQLKHMVGSRQQQQPQAEYVTSAAQQHHQQPSMSNRNHEAARRQLKLSSKQLGLENMPSAFKEQEAREMGALRQKVVRAMPKHLTEAVLTVLKNADDKRLPMSYADMENRLRQLRLRSSLQEHKTLRQILEAMQSKGLLNGPSCPKEGYMEQEARHHEEEVRHQEDSRHQNPPKQIMLPMPQVYSSVVSNASNVRNLRESKRLSSRLHEQVFDSMSEENMKSACAQTEAVAPNLERSPDVQQQSIVVIKPVNNLAKKAVRGQNPALLIESMPNARSPRQGRETGGRTSPWGSPVNRPSRTQPGFGFGRESTGRFSSEEGAVFKLRRERILARAGTRDVQSEPSTPKSPKLIAIPQNTGKLRSSSASTETPESVRHIKVHSNAGNKVGESGRRVVRSSSIKEETAKSAPEMSFRLRSGRDLMSMKKSASVVSEPEQHQQKEHKLRRRSSDGKCVAPYERDGTSNSTGPAELIVLRNRSLTGKRITLPEPDLRMSATTTSKRVVVNGGSKPGAGGKIEKRVSLGSAPTTPRSSARNVAEHGRNRQEQGGGVVDHVRVTDGDALDQSNGRSPLVGLTNRLQSTEIGLGELEREGQEVKTPRAGILVKKMFSNLEGNLVSEIFDLSSEEAQPSPVSVLDVASFSEKDVTPLALNMTVDGMQGPCDDDNRESDAESVQQGDTALQEWRQLQINRAEDRILLDGCSQQLLFVRESAKILPPQGEDKPLIIQSQAEKVYVRDVLVVSGATMGMKAINSGSGMIDTTVFDYLEKQGAAEYGLEQKAEPAHVSDKWEKERQVLDRRMLFDCVNETLNTLLVPYVNPQPWMQVLHIRPLRRRPAGQTLVQQLWDELKSLLPEKPSQDICDSLYTILQKDLVQPRNSWTEFTGEIEVIGLEIEKMIFKDLIEEALSDLARISRRRASYCLETPHLLAGH